MAEGISAFGTKLGKGAGGPPLVYTDIAELTSIEVPAVETDIIDVTHHQSPGGFKEYVLGLRDGGEVTIEGNYLPADPTQDGSTGLIKDNLDGTLSPYQVTFPDPGATKWTFDAYVRSFVPRAPHDGKLSFRATLKVTGQPVLA